MTQFVKTQHYNGVAMQRTVKNFGGQKVWRKELLQDIGGKNFGEKACVVSCNQLEISAALPFRQVSKRIANVETDFRNCPRNKHRSSDSVLRLVGWLSRLIHCGSHDPWLSVLKRMAKSTELLKKSFRANGKLELPTTLILCPLAVRNIIDEDIKTFGRVPRG